MAGKHIGAIKFNSPLIIIWAAFMKKVDKKIKLGIFVDGDFIPSFDGAANRFHYLSRALQTVGIEVIVFHGYRGWSDIELIKKEKFKTYILPIESYYKDLKLIASIIKKEGIDIIQFDNLEPIILQGVRLSDLTKTYLVSEMHYMVKSLANDLNASLSRIKSIEKMEEFVGKSIDHLICLSRDDRPLLIEDMKVSDERVSVIPSGIDAKAIKYWGSDFEKRTIIFLGNLFFEPNMKAVQAIYKYIYPELRVNNFKFLIVGDCPKNIKTKYQKDDFKFLGTVKDLNQVFEKATFALAPILGGTGLRIKILNYLAAGIPVIATSDSILGLNNKSGIIIEDDFKNYPQIIMDLMDHKNKVIELSQKGRTIMRDNFEWKIIAEKIRSTYQKILRSPLKDKEELLQDIPKLDNQEPVWLEEAKKKKRFTERNQIKGKFKYVIVQDNKINIIR